MKQSKVFLFIGLVVCAATVIATPAKKRKLTPEEIEQRKYNFFGGYLMQPQETKVVSILNEQKIVSVSVLEKIAAEMQELIKLPVKVNEKNNVAVTLKVCECDKLGPLVVLPDSATACVSAKMLAADVPSESVLEARVSKELWRGLIYALGGGNTFFGPCVMKQVSSLDELDAIPSRTACPDAFTRAMNGANKLGIKPARRVSYRQACKEGWAPAPTNDVQRAILERVRTEKGFEEQTKNPTKPIRIKFDKKK